ncbi:TonB-dependent receptor [Sphingobium indicum]|uniref:TonB-dependent receptor n=2 Tax=Sphingobium indicum TaxID=332055 RepID=A0A1L5BLT8_SPHIB|nr:TonB-dependent receptor [Sphingobium indicum]APL93881.1 TonB-dependent receptor [Sphingobium indicum B90A]KEY98324.1 TonB-dependent receptor [Sphingomonas sp. BHC-A]NYI21553.1 iron complex outermembrane receptor protein [Sphingobium indicum]RYM03663.1 TonB-dependent receptor [Sphingobium indicum]
MMKGLYCGGALAALAAASAASAQTAPLAEPQAKAGLPADVIADIIVTARKREENLQETPIAISAFGNETLEARGATRVDAIAGSTPNLTLSNSPGFGAQSSPAIYVRGIGQKDFSPFTEPGVGLYLDGVYIARSVGGLLDLVDIDRVEVLRGPQGTLFGRNTIGGAVSITSRQPDFDHISGSVALTIGNYRRRDFKASLNLPLTDSLAVTLSGATINRDGNVRRSDGRDLGNEQRLVGRFALRWKASSRMTLNWSVDGTRVREHGPAFRLTGIDYRSRIFNPDNLPLALTAGGTPLPPGVAFGTPQNGTVHVIAPPDGAFPPAVVAATGGYRSTLNFPVIDLNGSAPGGQIYPSQSGDAPTDNFALLNNYLATFLGGQPCLSPPNGSAPYNPSGDTANRACYNNQYVTRTNQGTGADFSNIDIWGTALNIDLELSDSIDLKSISAYRKLRSASDRDGDHSPLEIVRYGNDPVDQEQVSQEVQLLGSAFGDRLKWILGAYYFRETGVNLNQVSFTPLSFEVGGYFRNTSIAGFGQLTFDITDRLSLTPGLRWTRDRKFYDATAGGIIANRIGIVDPRTQYPGGLPACGVLNPSVICPLGPTEGTPFAPGQLVQQGQASTQYSDLTPMVNLAYKAADGLLLYTSYSEGFKGGGFTHRTLPLPILPGGIPSFDPETVKVYEAGFKLDAFGRRLRLNAAFFNTDYSNLQIQVFVGPAPQIKNVGSARIRGLELEASLAPGGGWRLEGGLGYLDARYTSLDAALVNGGLTRNAVTLSSKFEQVPDWSINASLSKSMSIGDVELTPRVDWSYRSKVYFDSINTDAIAQPAYSLVNASLTAASLSDGWTFSAQVTNLFDKAYYNSGVFNETFGVQENLIGRSREWSITLKKLF